MRRSLMTTLAVACLFASAAWAHGGGVPRQPTRYLDFGGVHLAVYEGQGTQGPGVLLVHGNTASADYFARTLAPLLAGPLRIAAVELPGCGNSEDAPAYSAGYLAQAIAFAAHEVHAEEGVLVGWSLGGDLVLQASHLLPNVKGYLLIGTAPLGFAPELPPPLLSPAQSPAGAAVQYGFVPNLTQPMIDDYVRAFFRPGYPGIPAEFFQAGYRADPGIRLAVATAAAGLDPTFRDEVAAIKALTVPVALIAGQRDAFVNPAFLSGLAAQLPTLWHHQVFYVPETGHAVQWERPVFFALLLHAFVHDVR